MTVDKVISRLRAEGSEEVRLGMSRFGIPNDRAFGIPMNKMKAIAKEIGKDHDLALALWETGWYEARTVAIHLADPKILSEVQMDAWTGDFDNWAICDTACMHLYDRSRFAWEKVALWAESKEEFVKRAAFALIWALSVHDKKASDNVFIKALQLIEAVEDQRPLVKKAVNMALRATGKRNPDLNHAAMASARVLAQSADKHRAWIGSHALRELASEKVQKRVHKK